MTRNTLPARDRLRGEQLAALNRLLRAVAARNPFYAPVLREAGLAEGVDALDAFAAHMPLTRKEMLVEDQRRHPPYGSNLTFPLECYSRYNQTSATSGTPLRWLDTPEGWQWMLESWKQVFRAASVTAADRLYFAFSFGPFLGFWTAFDAATQLGCLCIPGGGTGSAARLESMRDNRATVLLATPSYALRLAEVATAEGIDLAEMEVRTILVAGEPGGSIPSVRRLIEERWPAARVFDHHGMTEVGPVSYQCPEKPGTLLVMQSSYLAEILDPESGQPVPRGEAGELVLTTLGRIGSPLIRYRTGDLVREDLEAAERFGQAEMALEGGILGRTDDMVQVRGVNVYPSALEEIVRSVPEVVEYRVEIETRGSMTEMQLHVEPTEGLGEPHLLARRIQSMMRSRLSLRVPVTVCTPGTLPRFEMKSRRWVRR